MIVQELIKELEKFDPDIDVTITDGFEGNCYHTCGCEITKFEDENGFAVVDIGIGGLRI